MQRWPGLAAPIAKEFSMQVMQYPGISQAVNGAIKAQVESWKWFSLLEPRVGLVWALVLTRHTSVQHQELSGLEQAGWTPSSPSSRVCRQSPRDMSQPCSPSSAPLSNKCTQGLSRSRKGQTRLLQAGLVSENQSHLWGWVSCLSPECALHLTLSYLWNAAGGWCPPCIDPVSCCCSGRTTGSCQPGHNHSPGSPRPVCVRLAD